MCRQKYCFLLLFLSLTVAGVKAQQLNQSLIAYRDSFPQEKVYVHTDKSYYNPGETIWFKCYILNGLDPSLVSRNLFAELITENGDVISRKTMPVVSSSGAASFDIAPNFNGSVVYLRAYTTLMKNNDTAFFFTKPLKIITAAAKGAKPSPLQTTLRFFAEGGDMVAGLSNQVAFAATDQHGDPVSVKGLIRGKSNAKVADFQTLHDGMGSVSFQPEAGTDYAAVWKDPNGVEHTTNLPPVKP